MLGATALRRRMLVSLEINNKDRAYQWVLAWMAHQANTPQATARSWIKSHQLSVETMAERPRDGDFSSMFQFVAGPGTHWFKYRGAWMQVRFDAVCVDPHTDEGLTFNLG